MKLSPNIIRQLIAEEINKSLLTEDDQAEAILRFGSAIRSLKDETQLSLTSMGSLFDQALSAVRQEEEQAAQQARTPGNRKDVQEACGDMKSIDMETRRTHDGDHEGNMAKRQMFKTAQYAAEIFDNIQDGDEFPAWIQSKMTKIADYTGAVKHYLEYDHVMGEKLDKDADAGDYVKDFQDSDAPQFKGKSKKKKQQMAVAAYLDAKED
jgi:hypothetical protein